MEYKFKFVMISVSWIEVRKVTPNQSRILRNLKIKTFSSSNQWATNRQLLKVDIVINYLVFFFVTIYYIIDVNCHKKPHIKKERIHKILIQIKVEWCHRGLIDGLYTAPTVLHKICHSSVTLYYLFYNLINVFETNRLMCENWFLTYF